jgi:hypothetical protein
VGRGEWMERGRVFFSLFSPLLPGRGILGDIASPSACYWEDYNSCPLPDEGSLSAKGPSFESCQYGRGE